MSACVRSTSVADHVGDDALPEVVVGHADDRDLGHARVVEQHRLDLAGPDPVAAALDQVVLGAADDPVLAGRRRPTADVAGGEPAAR